MTRCIATIAILAALLLSGLLPSAVGAETTLLLPDTMAAVGDSITQAASTGGTLGADAPQNSWSTGTSATVNSHYLRLLALGAPVSGQNNNRSVSGAKAAGLNSQMQDVVRLQPDYLTVQIGGNDLCTDTVAAMTPVADFRAQFQTAMATLTAGSLGTYVYVVSIPDAYQLWSLFKDNFWARFTWSIGGVCQSLLANPTSTQQVDVQRRQEVRQRNVDYNTQLAQVCATFASRCRFDNNAVFNTQFATSDIAGDYFHPSIAGQAKLASVSWLAGYTWAPTPTPTPTPTPPAGNTGLLNPTANAAASGGDGDGYQTSPTSAYADDGLFAVDRNSGSSSSTSCADNGKDAHLFYNYGLTIPAGATIKGIDVRLDAKVDSTSGSPKLCVQLSWNGGASWTTVQSTATLGTAESTRTLGSATDTWGRSWAIGDFSNANFRVRVIDVASSTARDFSLDWVAVRVSY